VIHHEIQVLLGERSYSIHVGAGMEADLGLQCRRNGLPGHLALITDRTVGSLYLRAVKKSLVSAGYEVTPIVVPPGEKEKSLTRANNIFTQMLKNGIGRKAAVIALGGGVIGDLSGFVAATYHRGLPLVQIPTTLLSQVDSSIGGKTAVNHPLGKNMIGAFHQPVFVWTDVQYLRTLPKREVVCGLGEIVKYGVILDSNLFSFIESRLDEILRLSEETVMHVQAVCSSLKAALVSQDERELGKRIILNYGHTLGHALEAAGQYRLLKHGEAVLMGMIGENYLAREMGLLSKPDHDRILDLIRRVPLQHKAGRLLKSAIMAAMGRDKKSVTGKKRFVLPVRIGETTIAESVPPELIQDSLSYLFESLPSR